LTGDRFPIYRRAGTTPCSGLVSHLTLLLGYGHKSGDPVHIRAGYSESFRCGPTAHPDGCDSPKTPVECVDTASTSDRARERHLSTVERNTSDPAAADRNNNIKQKASLKRIITDLILQRRFTDL